jgi:hypothetical protein
MGLHYVCFVLATLARHTDIFGNFVVEVIYRVITLSYNYDSQQLSFLLPTQHLTTLFSDAIAPLPAIPAPPYISVTKYKGENIYRLAMTEMGGILQLMQWSINSILIINQPANDYSSLVYE